MADAPRSDTRRPSPPVNPTFDRLAAYAWRAIVIGVVGLAVLWVMREARVVMFPIVIAVFLARALAPVSGWLRRHGWRPGLAALTSMVTFFLLLAGLTALVVPALAGELDSVRPTVTEAIDDIEDWLADGSPIEVSNESFDRFRERVGEEVDRLARSSEGGGVADRATLVAEVLGGGLLAVILTFFMLRDGSRFTEWVCLRVRIPTRARVRNALDAAWDALGGYLRGATLLGAVESAMIGVTLAVSGGGLVAPVMLITFLAAYVPLIGAIVAGVVAVLVAMVTGGTSAAIAVAVVALLVQQFDNDLLAPLIYGRQLSLHPVVILLGVVAGGALFGLVGTVLAVPVVAVAVNATRAFNAGAGAP